MNTEVEQLIAGPTVFICNECVDLCVAVIADQREKRAGVAASSQATRAV